MLYVVRVLLKLFFVLTSSALINEQNYVRVCILFASQNVSMTCTFVFT